LKNTPLALLAEPTLFSMSRLPLQLQKGGTTKTPKPIDG
jgi:hypothetical protein